MIDRHRMTGAWGKLTTMGSVDPFILVVVVFLAVLGGSLAFVVHRANKKNRASGIPMSDTGESSYAPPTTHDSSESTDQPASWNNDDDGT